MVTLLLIALAAAPVVVDHVTDIPTPRPGLGTRRYSPAPAEEAFVQKVPKQEQITGGPGLDYDLSKRDGVYVGWFGVVREVREQKGETVLLVEHKGFDGLTDSHILALDFNGGGDFTARIPGVGHHIEKLTLVKVYGVARVAKSAITVIAEYVRNWHQRSFTFIMAGGEQHGSDTWRKLNTVPLCDIYDAYPTVEYYVERLGKR